MDIETEATPIGHLFAAPQRLWAGVDAAQPILAGDFDSQSKADGAWTSLAASKFDLERLRARRIVTAERADPVQDAFDLLRTRVLRRLRQHNWTSIAITSPRANAGKSTVALNLAFSLANREDCRTVLLDLDLRCPNVARTLGIRDAPSIEQYLRGRAELRETFRRFRPNLAIASNGQPMRFPAELLQSACAKNAFRDLRQKLMPDVIVCDMPPMLTKDDLMAFLPNLDCVILVVEAGSDTLDEVDACERELAEASQVLGVVLNKCRHIAPGRQ